MEYLETIPGVLGVAFPAVYTPSIPRTARLLRPVEAGSHAKQKLHRPRPLLDMEVGVVIVCLECNVR